jgi:hypothetical protein
MSWLDKFKKLISRKNKKNKKEGKKQFIPPKPKKMNPDKIDPNRKIRECGICQRLILNDELMRKEPGTGKYFHILCIKEAKKFVGINV